MRNLIWGRINDGEFFPLTGPDQALTIYAGPMQAAEGPIRFRPEENGKIILISCDEPDAGAAYRTQIHGQLAPYER